MLSLIMASLESSIWDGRVMRPAVRLRKTISTVSMAVQLTGT